MDVMICKEYLSETLVDELVPILIAHNDEVGGEETNIDWHMYRHLQEMKKFHFYVARSQGKLLGYVGYITSSSIRTKGSIIALCDLIYVVPGFRGKFLSTKLIARGEMELRKFGVASVGQSVSVNNDYSPILERQGYVLEEKYFTKRIQPCH